MSDISARLALPYLQPAQAQKHVTHNEALLRLDLMVQMTVEAFGAQTPPGLAQEGQVWALGPAPTGAWAGRPDALAAWVDGAWLFVAPQEGWRAWSREAAELRVWDGTGWRIPPGQGDNLPGLGVNTTHDATNRLAVSGPAALFTHQGSDHRLTVNKAGQGDTASLVLQSGFSGRAEIGLAGSDDVTLKVSADGAAWIEALRIDRATGALSLGAGLNAALLADLDAPDQATGFYRFDAAAGTGTPPVPGDGHVLVQRFGAGLLHQGFIRADGPQPGQWSREYRAAGGWTGWARLLHGHDILGQVAMDGGQASGALFEQGTTADGLWRRFADGTQICTRRLVAPLLLAGLPGNQFDMPVAFAGDDVAASLSHCGPWGTAAAAENLLQCAVSASANTWEVFKTGDDFGFDGDLMLFALGRWL